MHIQNSRWQLKPLELGCSLMHLFQVGQGSAILFFQCIKGRLYLHPIVTGQDLQALTSWIPVFSSAQSLHKILLMKHSRSLLQRDQLSAIVIIHFLRV